MADVFGPKLSGSFLLLVVHFRHFHWVLGSLDGLLCQGPFFFFRVFYETFRRTELACLLYLL